MKRLILLVSLILAPALIPVPAHAGNSVDLVCTELPAPSIALVSTSIYKDPPARNYASLVNFKAHHPIKHVVANGVSCEIGADFFTPQSWRQACHLVSESYGQWVANTHNSSRAPIWKPVRCKDSLFYRVQ